MSGEITELSARQALSAMEGGPFNVLLRTLATGKEVLKAIVRAEEDLPGLSTRVQEARIHADDVEHVAEQRMATAASKAAEAERLSADRVAEAEGRAERAERRADEAERAEQVVAERLKLTEDKLAAIRREVAAL